MKKFMITLLCTFLMLCCHLTTHACEDGYHEYISGSCDYYIMDDSDMISISSMYSNGKRKGSSADEVLLGGNLSSIKQIKVHGSVQRLGKNNFKGFQYVEKIILEEGLEEIGASAFSGTSVEEIIIPASVKVIEDYAFAHCEKLKRVIFQEGIESIGAEAFYGCKQLSDINFPSSLFAVGKNVLGNTMIEKNDIHPEHYIEDGILWKSKIQDDLVRPFILEPQVRVIADDAISHLAMNKIQLHNQLIGIGAHNFSNSIMFGEKNYEGCNIPSQIQYIGEEAFYLAHLEGSLVLPPSLKVLSKKAFCGTDITSVTIGSGIKTMEERIFDGCNQLQHIQISPQMMPTYIHAKAFVGCPYYDKLIRYSEDGLIYVQHILMELCDDAHTPPPTLTIKEGCKIISYRAFYQYPSHTITKLTIPKSVTYIGSIDLKDTIIYYQGNIDQWNHLPFYEKRNDFRLVYEELLDVSSYPAFLSNNIIYSHQSLSDRKPSVIIHKPDGTKIDEYYIHVKYKKDATQPRVFHAIYTLDYPYTGTGDITYRIIDMKPKNTEAKLSGDYDDIKLTWDAPLDEVAEYHIYMQRSGYPYKYQKKTKETSFIKKDLADKTTYYFKVVPCVYDDQGNIVEVNSACSVDKVVTWGKSKQPILKPLKDGRVRVCFYKTSLKVDGYQISRTTNKDTKKVVNTKYSKKDTHIYKSVKNKTYYYRIRYFRKIDGKMIYSPWSDPIKYIRKT